MEDDKKLAGGSERKGTGGEAAGLAPVDPKKEAKRLRDAFELHVRLIMAKNACTKAQATFTAWCEGEAGYRNRLALLPTP